jgi:hypothetical protein
MPSLGNIAPPAEPLVELCIRRLARKLKIPPDQILVLRVTSVIWPDASLGCPKHGITTARVETPGFNILLEAAGNTWPFHTDLVDRVILCPSRPPGDIFMEP